MRSLDLKRPDWSEMENNGIKIQMQAWSCSPHTGFSRHTAFPRKQIGSPMLHSSSATHTNTLPLQHWQHKPNHPQMLSSVFHRHYDWMDSVTGEVTTIMSVQVLIHISILLMFLINSLGSPSQLCRGFMLDILNNQERVSRATEHHVTVPLLCLYLTVSC